MKMMAPIPGMSLTTEPGNAPYEQPPLQDTPEQSLGFYFEKLEDEDVTDEILFALENEVPLEVLVDSMTSVGVMEGYHSVDIKILISPILHEYIGSLADAAGITYVEMGGPSKDEKQETRDKKRVKMMLAKALEGDVDVSEESLDKAGDALQGESSDQEEMPLEGGSMNEMPLISRRSE